MAYELAFDPEVEDEITDFALCFPGELQNVAIDCIEERLNRLAANPLSTFPHRGPRPLVVFEIRVGRTWCTLVVAFRFSLDEKSIIVTGFRRLLM